MIKYHHQALELWEFTPQEIEEIDKLPDIRSAVQKTYKIFLQRGQGLSKTELMSIIESFCKGKVTRV